MAQQPKGLDSRQVYEDGLLETHARGGTSTQLPSLTPPYDDPYRGAGEGHDRRIDGAPYDDIDGELQNQIRKFRTPGSSTLR